MGRNISAASTADFGLQNVRATSKIVAGDLLCFSDTGGVYPFSPAVGMERQNSNVAKAKRMLAQTNIGELGTSPINYYMGPLNGAFPAAVLSNGNVVMVFSGNGTTNTTSISFKIVDRSGAAVVAQTEIFSGYSLPVAVVTTTTGFAVLWHANVAANLAMSTYTNEGTQILGKTDVITNHNSSADGPSTRAIGLASGFIAIAYRVASSNNCALVVFNQSGVQQGATITIESGASPGFLGVMQDPNNGDIVVCYMRQAATISTKLARYTSALVAVGSVLSFGGTDTALFSQSRWSKHSAIMFDNGNVAVLHGDTVNLTSPAFSFFSNTNTLITTVTNTILATFGGAGAANVNVPMIATDGTDLHFMMVTTQTGFRYDSYTSRGARIVVTASVAIAEPILLLSSPAANGLQAYCRLHALGEGGFVVMLNGNNNVDQWSVEYLYLSKDRLTNSVENIYGTSTPNRGVSLSLNAGNGVIMNFTHADSATTRPTIDAALYGRSAIFGVAQAAAVARASVQVATKGSFTVNQELKTATSFDSRFNTVAGNKGVVAGYSVALGGLADISPRNRNNIN